MLIQLAITGMLVALLPLAIVWSSRDPDKYRKLVWTTIFLTFDLIMFGAFTRLTDSGLGCPDWPGCYGHANPLQAREHITAAEAMMPTGPVTVIKAWIEMIHRYVAMSIGVLIIAIVVVAWRNWRASRRTDPRFTPWYPMVLLGFICLQGAFGAWTVTMKLQPVIVTTHLILGMGLLALLTWLGQRQLIQAPVVADAARLRLPALAAAAALAVQIALGGWVSTNYATLACTEFPLCNGSVVPEMDWANGFALWRELGMTASGDFLPFPALIAIHWVHRTFAFAVVALVAWIGWRALKTDGLRTTGRWLLIVIALQFTTGVSTIYLSWPLALAVIHNGGAALLTLLLTVVNYRAYISSRLRLPHAAAPRTASASA
jgi:cytochrome c oxidase assembly protein subunit 15